MALERSSDTTAAERFLLRRGDPWEGHGGGLDLPPASVRPADGAWCSASDVDPHDRQPGYR